MDDFLKANPHYANSGKINKAIYQNWKIVSKKFNTSFEGEHNGFYAEVKTNLKTEKSETSILTSKQLQSTEGSILPRIAEITYFTYITKNLNFNPINIKIRKDKLGSYILGAFDFNSKKISTKYYKYLIKTNNEKSCKELIEVPVLKESLKSNVLVKFIVFPKTRKLKITFNKVFSEVEEIENLFLFLKVIDSMIEA